MIKGLIADAVERQEFWTMLMRDDGESTVNRLKASELLAKIQGDFSGSSDLLSPGGTEVALERLSDEHLANLVANATTPGG